MVKKNWKIWEKDHSVEARTFDRAQKRLPEMESAKQLRILIMRLAFQLALCQQKRIVNILF